MKPQNQLFAHDPANDVFGDCHRACIASILELPIEEVEHFAVDNPSSEVFETRIRGWCRSRGYTYTTFMYDVDPRTFMEAINPGIYYILGGESSIGVSHSVVCLDGEIVHDPSDNGIIGPSEDDGFYYIDIVGAPQAWAKE